ncbi:MAG: hypothetical protein P8P48_13290 [Saprospiraceae bacterium]|nr:hypothetical protein [Saprospiraceae bacterium]
MQIEHKSIISKNSFKLLIPVQSNSEIEDFSFLSNYTKVEESNTIIDSLQRVYNSKTAESTTYTFP